VAPRPDLVDLRAEYLAAHPDSPYLEHVNRGEIVKGMDVYSVIASWGRPGHRAPEGDTIERWLYVDEDEASGQRFGYALEFRGGTLNRWHTYRPSTGLKTGEPGKTPAPTTEQRSTGKTIPKD
jgi:hypothetical protein